jgi:hypothetical protein
VQTAWRSATPVGFAASQEAAHSASVHVPLQLITARQSAEPAPPV